MRISETGQDHYHDGHCVGRYGRSPSLGPVYCWYHSGLGQCDEPAWAMEPTVEFQISVSVDHIVAIQQPDGAWLIDRDAFTDQREQIDGNDQYVARASDDYVSPIRDPADVLRGSLYIASGDEVYENYHVEAGEA